MDVDQAIAAWTERLCAAVEKDPRSLDAIAKAAHVAPSTLTRLCQGNPDGPRLRTYLALAGELGVNPATWLRGLGGRS